MSTRKVFFSIVSLILCLCLTAPALAGVLKLPEGVKIIEDEAFYKDTSLDEVILPEGIEEIGERAFADSSLRKINLPDSLQYVAESAFDNCVNLEHEGEPTVNPDDFEYEENGDGTCTVTRYKKTPSGDLVIPSKSPAGSIVTGIGYRAFTVCSGFTGSLTIPDSVTSIGYEAFDGCSGFTGSLTIPDSVTSIGDGAFCGCSGFTGSLTIPTSVTSIGALAFCRCSGFTGSLTIMDGVISIGESAFSECSGFTGSLTIPDSVISIGDRAFSSCRGFTGNLIISDRVTSIGEEAFNDCIGFTGSLTIPDSVISIGDRAFNWCIGFTGSLTIPDSVTSIGDSAFAKCRGFTGSLNIPNSVTSIGDSAFDGCSGFTGNLRISDSVTSIGNSIFFDCSGFTGSLNIPNSVTSIGDSAFFGCRGLTGSLTIPDSVISIGDSAFYVCSGFTGSLRISDSVTSIGTKAFDGCSGFTGSLTIPDSVTSIGNYAFDGCSGFTGSLTIPDSVTSIGNYAFDGCSGFTGSLTIPDSVTSIGYRAFYCCSGFTGSLTIMDGVISIGESAFSECNGFTGSLTIPDSVTSIGDEAFQYCSGFTGSLTIPNSVTSIGEGAFFWCKGFTGSLTIPVGVISIGENAFSYCNFERVSVPITSDDGTTHEVSRIAVYCPVDSYAWRWATEQSDFEPVEWDGIGHPTLPCVTNVEFESTTINVGTKLKFTVSTRNATHINICFEGEEYDEYPVDSNGNVTASRLVTSAMEGVRAVSFVPKNEEETGAPTSSYMITILSNGTLDNPVATWKEDIQKGETQIVSWDAVTNADGYALYLIHPNGNIDKINLSGNANYQEGNETTPYQYTWPSETFDEIGVWSALVMAYGEGYSQSSTRCRFNVYTGYKSWYGYLQTAKADTYQDATTSIPNGFVNDEDPVLVLDEAENRYFISMTLSKGGTALRWVDKQWIGNQLWIDPNLDARTPEVTAFFEEGTGVIFEVILPKGFKTIVIEKAPLNEGIPDEFSILGTYASGSFIDSDVEEGNEYRYQIYGLAEEPLTESGNSDIQKYALRNRAKNQSAVKTIDVKCYKAIPIMNGKWYADETGFRFEIDLPEDATILRLTKNMQEYISGKENWMEYSILWSKEGLTPGQHITYEDAYTGLSGKQFYYFIAYKVVNGVEKQCGRYSAYPGDVRENLLYKYKSWWEEHVYRPGMDYYDVEVLKPNISRLSKAYELKLEHEGDYAAKWDLQSWFGTLIAKKGHESDEERARNEKYLVLMVLGDILTSDENKARLELGSGLTKEEIEENVRSYAKNQRTIATIDNTVDLVFNSVKAIYYAASTTVKVTELSSGTAAGTSTAQKYLEKAVKVFFEILEDSIRDTVEEIDTRILVQSYRDEYANALKVMSQKNIDYLKKVYSMDGSVYQKLFPDETPAWRESIYMDVSQELIESFEMVGEGFDMDSVIYERLEKETGYTRAELENACDSRVILDSFFSKSNMKTLLNNVVKEIIKKVCKLILTNLNKNDDDSVNRLYNKLEPVLTSLIYFDSDLNIHLDLEKAKAKFEATTWTDVSGLLPTQWTFDAMWGIFLEAISGEVEMPKLDLVRELNSQGKLSNCRVIANECDLIDACAGVADDAWKLGESIYKVGKNIGEAIDLGDNKAEYFAYAELLDKSFIARNNIINAGNLSYLRVDLYNHHSLIESFDEMEKVRADFALLLLTDEAILINQKNMLKITKESNWKWDANQRPGSDERVYYPTEAQLEQYLKKIRDLRKELDTCPETYLELLSN